MASNWAFVMHKKCARDCFQERYWNQAQNKCEHIFQMDGLWLDVNVDMDTWTHEHKSTSYAWRIMPLSATQAREKKKKHTNPKSYMMEYLACM